MAKELLTDVECRRKRPGTTVRYLNDGDGLRLLIRPTGARYWLLRYRFDGAESTYSLGSYPEVGLSEAREKAAEARKTIKAGGHPTKAQRVRRAQRTEASKATLKAILFT